MTVQLSAIADLVYREKVDVVAFDNLAEIAPSLNRLLFELSKVSRKIEFIEVASDENLESKARRLGLTSASKLSPLQSSEVVAKLGKMGEGKKLNFFAPKTLIRVVRRRVPGSGGSSTMRFKRGIEAQIKFIAVRIEEKLKKAGLDYDVFVRESTGGYSSATFLVYASSEQLGRLVYPALTRSYAVKVEKIVSVFQPKAASHSERPVIVGYDPGIASGLAVLGLSGEQIAVYSGRNLDRGNVASLCSSHGKPVIVASDVSPPPESVRKLCSTFGAHLFSPSVTLSVEEKREFSRGLQPDAMPRNTHERDALAAAYKAYLHYQGLFESIREKTAAEGLHSHLCEVVEKVLAGSSISKAIEDIRFRYASQERKPIDKPVQEHSFKNEVEFLRNEFSLLKARLADMEERNNRLEDERGRLQERLTLLQEQFENQIWRDREVENLRLRIAELNNLLVDLEAKYRTLQKRAEQPLQALRELASGQYLLVQVLDDLSMKSVSELGQSQVSVRPTLYYVKNASAWTNESLNTLKKLGAAGLIVQKVPASIPPSFQEAELPLIQASEVDYHEIDQTRLGLVRSTALGLALQAAKEYAESNRLRKLGELRRLLEDTIP
ncbi:MAG: DUF460 domain-containing protein [Thermoprotei archaeon]